MIKILHDVSKEKIKNISSKIFNCGNLKLDEEKNTLQYKNKQPINIGFDQPEELVRMFIKSKNGIVLHKDILKEICLKQYKSIKKSMEIANVGETIDENITASDKDNIYHIKNEADKILKKAGMKEKEIKTMIIRDFSKN